MPLLIIREKNQADRLFNIVEKDLLIGRSDKSDLVLPNVSVSRHHVNLSSSGGRWTLQDLRSGNGTFLDGESVEQANIDNGSQIGIGKFTLIFFHNSQQALLHGFDSQELPDYSPFASDVRDTNTFQISPQVLEKMRDTTRLLNDALVVAADDNTLAWKPGEDGFVFGQGDAPPVKRMLPLGTPARLLWNGSKHVIVRTSRVTNLRVNGKAITDRCSLSPGDLIDIGGTTYQYVLSQ